MLMRYLLDTNILIYAYKNLGGCRSRIDVHEPQNICICPLNVYELEVGIAKSRPPEGMQLFLNDLQARFNQVALTNEAASQAAKVRAKLEQQGLPIGTYDLLFAGIALAHDLILVTRNTREFERVPGLKLEDWYD
jgi:tRNA(fMet)-specific endonuclease VapC